MMVKHQSQPEDQQQEQQQQQPPPPSNTASGLRRLVLEVTVACSIVHLTAA